MIFLFHQLAASKEEDMVKIDWHELLDRAQRMRSEANQSIYEEKRKAFIEKSVEIVEQNDAAAENKTIVKHS